MSEGSGWTGRLGRVLNARMEEMSFRSGVAVVAGVLALTGVGIAFAVMLAAGHQAAALPSAPSAASAAVPSSAAPSGAAPYPSASASPIQEASALAAAPQPQTAPASSAPASATPPWLALRPRRFGRRRPGSLGSSGIAPSLAFPPAGGPITYPW